MNCLLVIGLVVAGIWHDVLQSENLIFLLQAATATAWYQDKKQLLGLHPAPPLVVSCLMMIRSPHSNSETLTLTVSGGCKASSLFLSLSAQLSGGLCKCCCNQQLQFASFLSLTFPQCRQARPNLSVCSSAQKWDESGRVISLLILSPPSRHLEAFKQRQGISAQLSRGGFFPGETSWGVPVSSRDSWYPGAAWASSHS